MNLTFKQCSMRASNSLVHVEHLLHGKYHEGFRFFYKIILFGFVRLREMLCLMPVYCTYIIPGSHNAGPFVHIWNQACRETHFIDCLLYKHMECSTLKYIHIDI